MESYKRSELDAIDEETRRWLHDFTSWKRRKAADPSEVTIAFLLDYMEQRVYDYYFIQRNYTHLVPLLKAYEKDFGGAEGLVRLMQDAGSTLGR